MSHPSILASSSNFNPNNPVNLPVQFDSEEELTPHVLTSSGTGSSERTMRYTDQEDGESEDSQRTRAHDDHEVDLVLDEAHRSFRRSVRIQDPSRFREISKATLSCLDV